MLPSKDMVRSKAIETCLEISFINSFMWANIIISERTVFNPTTFYNSTDATRDKKSLIEYLLFYQAGKNILGNYLLIGVVDMTIVHENVPFAGIKYGR